MIDPDFHIKMLLLAYIAFTVEKATIVKFGLGMLVLFEIFAMVGYIYQEINR